MASIQVQRSPTAPNEAPAGAEATGHPAWGRLETLARATAHLGAAAPFLLAAVIETSHRWLPLSDDAVIASRSWEVLGRYPPALGQFSQLTLDSSHTVFDLGPLSYWLLTVPVHLNHEYGVLWGATVLCILGMSLAIEAGWAVYRSIGALAIATMFMLLTLGIPAVAYNAVWNPNIGALWFLSTCVLAWVSTTGRGGWLPLLAFSASISAQSHFMYVIPSLAVCAVAVVVVCSRFDRRAITALLLAAGVSIACWVVPFWQQMSGHPGNISLVLQGSHGKDELGWNFALKAYAAASGIDPLWARGIRPVTFFSVLIRLGSPPKFESALILASLTAVVVLGWRLGRRQLAWGGLAVLVASGGVIVTLAGIPSSGVLDVVYLDIILWPLGLMVWCVAVWAAVELMLWGIKLRGREVPEGSGALFRRARMYSVAAVVSALVVVSCVYGVGNTDQYLRSISVQDRLLRQSASQIGARLSRGPVCLAVSEQGDDLAAYGVGMGLFWKLQSLGWEPRLPPAFAPQLGPEASPCSGVPEAVVQLVAGQAHVLVLSPR